eukprot:symbB.v1.2.034412.t1/scaffold4432.1/size39741/2
MTCTRFRPMKEGMAGGSNHLGANPLNMFNTNNAVQWRCTTKAGIGSTNLSNGDQTLGHPRNHGHDRPNGVAVSQVPGIANLPGGSLR